MTTEYNIHPEAPFSDKAKAYAKRACTLMLKLVSLIWRTIDDDEMLRFAAIIFVIEVAIAVLHRGLPIAGEDWLFIWTMAAIPLALMIFGYCVGTGLSRAFRHTVIEPSIRVYLDIKQQEAMNKIKTALEGTVADMQRAAKGEEVHGIKVVNVKKADNDTSSTSPKGDTPHGK